MKVLRWILLVLVVLALVPVAGAGWMYWRVSHPEVVDLPLPSIAVAADSAAGRALLAGAEGTADHDALTAAFQTQEKGSWCGVASATTVLRARGAQLSQSGLFTPEASEVRSWFDVTFGGMNLDALGGLLRAHGAQVTVQHAADASLDAFRAEVARNLATPGDWLVVNYHRGTLDEAGGGHISPLSAYDADSDRVLMLDTATYKYPAHWVPVDRLFAAMDTVDSDGGLSRGWVVVR